MTGYRGPDRRFRSEDVRFPGRAWVVSGAGLLGLLLAAALWDGTTLAAEVHDGVIVHACSAGVVLALVATLLLTVHWRVAGLASSASLAVATSAVGGLMVSDLVIPWAGDPPPGGYARLAIAGIGICGALWAVAGPEVDTRLKPVRRTAVVAGSVVAGVGLVAIVDAAAGGRGALGVAEVMGALGWLGAGICGVERSLRRAAVALAWFSWGAVALGISELARTDLVSGGTSSIPVEVLRAGAVLLVVIGAVGDLARFGRARRGDLHGVTLARQSDRQAREQQERERIHEARNALLSVEGATTSLERLGDRLSYEQREQLERVLRSGIEDLRELLGGRRDAGIDLVPFSLAEVLADRVSAAESRGLTIKLRCGPNIRVRGAIGLTSRALDNLLLNAERHGGALGGPPVSVSVMTAGPTVIVQICDEGPGIPSGWHERIFDSGVRLRDDGDGEGVGLHVARRSMRRQGGDLWCEDRPERGACFFLSLPAVSSDEAVVTAPALHVVDHGG